MKIMGGIPSYVDLGGHKLFYWKFEGNKESPIVFLHGLLDEGFSNRRIVKELLGEGKNILVFDLPGYGRSRMPKVKYLYQIDVWADLLLLAFESLGLKNILLVGHSMGGLVSQHIVLKDTKRFIKKLIMLAPGGMPHPKRQEMQELLFPKTERDVVSLLNHLYGEEAPDPNFLLRRTLVTVWNSWENVYLQENTLSREAEIFHGKAMKGIKIPTLIISGEADEITPPSMIKKMKSYISKSNIIWLPKAKHAIHLEKPKEIAIQIRNFSIKY